jgi:formylglycine-generating enzyme required for sulfatase activity
MMSLQRALLLIAVAAGFSSAATELCAVQTPRGLQPYRDSIPDALVLFDMVPVPGGRVTLDSARTVEVAPFWIGRTEVTWDLYDVFALGLDTRTASAPPEARPSRPYGAPDYGFGHHKYPVISVTRAAAEAFCAWLSAKTGKKYRLPTEAEWVHVARLAYGIAALSADQIDATAWHAGNSKDKTHEVASLKADALGLHDLLGNAAEWVVADDGKLVTRGGSFRSARAAVGPQARAVQDESWNERDPQIPKSRWWLSDGPFVGFRIVRAIDFPNQ